MRVLVTGAYGLIGSACTARLARDGHAIVGVGREVAAARRSFPDVHWIAAPA
jgi:nucleoside-diphosphate-sugar epimerase